MWRTPSQPQPQAVVQPSKPALESVRSFNSTKNTLGARPIPASNFNASAFAPPPSSSRPHYNLSPDPPSTFAAPLQPSTFSAPLQPNNQSSWSTPIQPQASTPSNFPASAQNGVQWNVGPPGFGNGMLSPATSSNNHTTTNSGTRKAVMPDWKDLDPLL